MINRNIFLKEGYECHQVLQNKAALGFIVGNKFGSSCLYCLIESLAQHAGFNGPIDSFSSVYSSSLVFFMNRLFSPRFFLGQRDC